jgi:hypothetical protein
MTDYYESITSKIRARALLGMPILGEVFDSWLAEVERAAAVKAYAEGYQAASPIRMGPQRNPYKKEARND